MKGERQLKAAQGFLELGLHEEAARELASLPTQMHTDPEVLGIWIAVFCAAKEWEKMAKMSLHLATVDSAEPQWWVSFAYATRRSKSLEEARDILLKASQIHPKEAIIQFNLGCYACQLGELDTAKNYVIKAVRMDKNFRKMAIEDPDLSLIRHDLKTMLFSEEIA